MRWKNRKGSNHVEDRRGQSIPTGSRRGMGIAGGLGIGRILFSLFSRGSGKTKLMLIVGLVVAMVVFNFNPLSLVGGPTTLGSNSRTEQVTTRQPAPDDEYGDFLDVMTGINERFWAQELPKYNIRFTPAKMAIYSVGTQMDDGSVADARMGPFYLPSEQRIYIDPTFFEQMRDDFGVEGEFARAYVVAHEYGHHVQYLMGRTTALHSKHGKISKKEYNRESVRLELHADFLAGVFAHFDEKNFDSLDKADIQSAMQCAKAIGDDMLMKRAGQRINTDHFTHGTSEQRARWFMKGFNTGGLRVGEQIYSMNYDRL
jgi:uncharacterized protein